MLLLLSACNTMRIDGVDGFTTVGTAAAVDIVVDRAFVVGTGEVGTAVATALVLTTEPDWCENERERLEGLASLAAAADLTSDASLCEIAPDLFAGTLGVERSAHDPDRRSLFADVCAGSACGWAAMPVGEALPVPSGDDPFTAGVYTVMRGGVEPAEDLWDRASCAPADAYWAAAAGAWDTWTVEDATLTFDSIDGPVRGTYEGALVDADGASEGTFEANFSAEPCLIEVEGIVFF